ncbi:TPA: cell envelope integrity protein TolA [Klebsiella variicola]|nr:cell envelope integrity protein TolA [Klebsiella variicola]HDK6397561.1 cell envelope integrity protein TolA [Klebsiella variicola]HDK6597857.1 cell envelope integrity protein TolA [Klebsiella variicola]
MNKLCIIALTAFMLVGCAPKPAPKIPKNLYGYAANVKKAVDHNFFDSINYKDRGCTLKVTQPPGEQIQKIEIVSGDDELCKRAIEAINDTVDSGELPTKPKGLPATILFDFKP